MIKTIIISIFLFLSTFSYAGSFSGISVHTVKPNVYALVGELGNRSETNYGNNATFGVIVTSEGLILIDSGGSYKGAQAIHHVIRTQISDLPIIKVINTGGQDHRFFGNNYFTSQEVQIISSTNAVADQKERYTSQFGRLERLIGEQNTKHTMPKYADITFDTEYEFTSGTTTVKLIHSAQGHTPGDTFVYLPKESIIFSGDIIYTTRMLSIRPYSNSGSWLTAFESIQSLNPDVIIPGHGAPNTLAKAEKDTYNYIKTLRSRVLAFMDKGGDMSEISTVDMSDYNYLLNSDSLSSANAQQVYSELEWE